MKKKIIFLLLFQLSLNALQSEQSDFLQQAIRPWQQQNSNNNSAPISNDQTSIIIRWWHNPKNAQLTRELVAAATLTGSTTFLGWLWGGAGENTVSYPTVINSAAMICGGFNSDRVLSNNIFKKLIKLGCPMIALYIMSYYAFDNLNPYPGNQFFFALSFAAMQELKKLSGRSPQLAAELYKKIQKIVPQRFLEAGELTTLAGSAVALGFAAEAVQESIAGSYTYLPTLYAGIAAGNVADMFRKDEEPQKPATQQGQDVEQGTELVAITPQPAATTTPQNIESNQQVTPESDEVQEQLIQQQDPNSATDQLIQPIASSTPQDIESNQQVAPESDEVQERLIQQHDPSSATDQLIQPMATTKKGRPYWMRTLILLPAAATAEVFNYFVCDNTRPEIAEMFFFAWLATTIDEIKNKLGKKTDSNNRSTSTTTGGNVVSNPGSVTHIG